jgi:hypothetical protein
MITKAIDHLTMQISPIKPLQHWLAERALPESHGGDFRKWFKSRKKPPRLGTAHPNS